jgi:hypothetical protein
MTWIFTLLGLAMTAAGCAALAYGWPLVPLERGWTLVIAGSTVGSAGLLCLVLVKLAWETRRMRLALERALSDLAAEEAAASGSRPVATARDTPIQPIQAPSPVPNHIEPIAPPSPRDYAATAPDHVARSRSFTVGDTTFVVFVDGSIEAHTPGGIRRFASMREVRSYLDENRVEEAP